MSDVNEIFREMKAITAVESHLNYDEVAEQAAKEKIRVISKRLETCSLKSLYNSFVEFTGNKPCLGSKEKVIEYITVYFMECVHTIYVESVPTGIVLLIENDSFYEKLEAVLDGKRHFSIEENLRRNGIAFTKSDTLFFGGPMG